MLTAKGEKEKELLGKPQTFSEGDLLLNRQFGRLLPMWGDIAIHLKGTECCVKQVEPSFQYCSYFNGETDDSLVQKQTSKQIFEWNCCR